MKKIRVNVVPPCISWSREQQYAWEVENRYEQNLPMPDNVVKTSETDTEVCFTYHR